MQLWSHVVVQIRVHVDANVSQLRSSFAWNEDPIAWKRINAWNLTIRRDKIDKIRVTNHVRAERFLGSVGEEKRGNWRRKMLEEEEKEEEEDSPPGRLRFQY